MYGNSCRIILLIVNLIEEVYGRKLILEVCDG